MSEHDNNLASDLSVGENQKPNRKEPKQISFRVSESEYEKLRSSAETLNMSVPNFVKKKAHGSRLVAPKYCNQHQHDAPNYEGLEYNINAVRERLDEIWQNLN